MYVIFNLIRDRLARLNNNCKKTEGARRRKYDNEDDLLNEDPARKKTRHNATF